MKMMLSNLLITCVVLLLASGGHGAQVTRDGQDGPLARSDTDGEFTLSRLSTRDVCDMTLFKTRAQKG